MKRLLLGALLALIAALIHIGILVSPFGDRIELKALDLWSLIRGSRSTPDDIVIIAMNEASYQNLKIPLNQAWPRSKHAELLERLGKAGVKKVIFDVLFIDAGPDQKIDQRLATDMAKVPVVLGADALIKDYSSGSGSFKLEELLLPFEPFHKAAASLGLVGFPEDHGYVRRFLVDRTAQTKDYPTLAEAAAGFDRTAQERPESRDLINYYGPAGTIPFAHYYQVIDKEHPIPDEALKNKTVFVGLVLQTDVGPSQKDVFFTPFGRVFGTEIHATAALNLIYKDWIRRAGSGIELALLTLITLLACTGIFSLRPLWGTCITLGLFIIWFSSGYFALTNNLFLPGLTLTCIVAPLCLLSSVLYYYFVTRKAELKMLSAFELYVSPQMAKEVAQNQRSLSLGGEKVWATAMFTDIQGFTSLAETMPPEQVSAMLNAYFTEVMDVVFKNDGTLLKFIGDAIFVIWGAPVRINNHAEKACQTALEIQKEVKRFNDSRRFPPLNTRIGVHTGPMVVGNLGSSKRFDYTAIGDSVNLSSRIEGINKYFGTSIMITEETRKELSNSIPSLPMGAIKAAGKDEAVKIFALFSDVITTQISTEWNAAIENFRQRKWSEATKIFTDLTTKEPRLEKACKLFIKQIEIYQQSTPPDAWQGELTFLDK